MASINKIQLPDNNEYDINDARIPADENPASKEWVNEQGFKTTVSSADINNALTTSASSTTKVNFISSGYEVSETFSMQGASSGSTLYSNKLTLQASGTYSYPANTLYSSESLGGKGFIAKTAPNVLPYTNYTVGVIKNAVASGSSSTTEYILTLPEENSTLATQDWVNAQGFGSGGSSIDTNDLQVKKLSLLDPGNSVAGYLAPQTSYGGLELSAKTFAPRIIPTDSISGTVGQVSAYTTQLLDGGVALNTSYSDANPDGITKLIFPTDRTTDQTFATQEWVNDHQWSDSNGEPGRVLIDADNIELTLGDQAAGILISQYNGDYTTTIWGNINLSGIVSNISMSSTGAVIEYDGECTSICDPYNLYLQSDGDNGTSSIDMYNTEIRYHSTTHKFTGDITAQRSGETTASKVITAADFTYTGNVLTIDLT